VDTMVAVGPFQMKLLDMDDLKGKQRRDTQGNSWSFGAPQIRQLAKTPSAEVRLLQAAPALPPSKLTNVKPYPLPLGARAGTAPVLAELREQGVVVPSHSPYNSPVWPVRKPNGKWQLTVNYCRLNVNMGLLTAAVPNIAELISTIQEHAHPILATIDVKDMFFMVPLQPEDQSRFAFTWEGQQYTLTRLPQSYKYSPKLAYHALAQELEAIPIQAGVNIYQYIDEVLVGGSQIEEVREAQWDIITHLESIGLMIPPEKIQVPSSQVKFLGIWWREGMTCIPPDTLSSLDLIKMPESKKDLQHALGLLLFWRKHIPDFSIIARPLYDLLRKKSQWEWTQVHDEVLRLLVFEANAYRALGPIHPTDPVQIEWRFA